MRLKDGCGGPAFSIVCPVYNAASFVLRSLDSVFAQTYPPAELIVVDDGSTDDTVATVSRSLEQHTPVRSELLTRRHRGPGAARNAGIERAKCEWVAFLDADDIWLPDKLERVAQSVRVHPEINLVCHSEWHVKRDGSRSLLDYGARFDPHRPLPRQLYHCNMFSTSAVTCRRDLLVDSGLFETTLMSIQDYDMWLRMSPRMKPYFIREVLGAYHDREGSITSSGEFGRWSNYLRVAARHRDKVSPTEFWYRVGRLTASFGLKGLRRLCCRGAR